MIRRAQRVAPALLVVFLVALLAAIGCRGVGVSRPGGASSPAVPPRSIVDHDVVVFLGDSVTWQGPYPAILEHFFHRRYPDRRVEFFNRAVRGDTVPGALDRYDRDVEPLRPGLVIVMLGLNDGGYRSVDRYLLRYYVHNLETLVRRIRSRGTTDVVLVTPTCVEPVDYRHREYNRMLAAMAEAVVALGRREAVFVVDLFTFFSDALARASASAPPVRLMVDPRHPAPAGHLVIAHRLLTALAPPDQGQRQEVVEVALAPSAEGGRVLVETGHRNLFVPPAARAALGVVPFMERFGGVKLRLTGLARRARLTVGGEVVAECSPSECARGVDLDLLDGAPWTMAAARAYALDLRRQQLLRDVGMNEARDPLAAIEATIDEHPAGSAVYTIEVSLPP